MIEGSVKAKIAGLSVSVYVLLGLGGKSRSREHAVETARVLNAIDPDFIRVRTLIIQPGTATWDARERGDYMNLTPEEILVEERMLIDLLEGNSSFVSDHVSNYCRVDGRLPQDKGEMLATIDTMLETIHSDPEMAARLQQYELLRRL
jgi:histone acetyltransferase (RNA polymerase elongator complex component)